MSELSEALELFELVKADMDFLKAARDVVISHNPQINVDLLSIKEILDIAEICAGPEPEWYAAYMEKLKSGREEKK